MKGKYFVFSHEDTRIELMTHLILQVRKPLHVSAFPPQIPVYPAISPGVAMQGGVTPQSSVLPPATAVKHKVKSQEAKIVTCSLVDVQSQ